MSTEQRIAGALLALSLLITGCSTMQPGNSGANTPTTTSGPETTQSSANEAPVEVPIDLVVNTVGTSGCNPEAEGDCYLNLGQTPRDNAEENTFNVNFPGCEAGHWAEVLKHECTPGQGDGVKAACELQESSADDGPSRWIGVVLTDDLRTNQLNLEAVYKAPTGQEVGFAPALWLQPNGSNGRIPQLPKCEELA